MVSEETSERHDLSKSSDGVIHGSKVVPEVRISSVGTDLRMLEALLLVENLPVVSVPDHIFQ
jgi:hypothetical protein